MVWLRLFFRARLPELICAIIAVACVFVDATLAARFLRHEMSDGDGKYSFGTDSIVFNWTLIILLVVGSITFFRTLKRSQRRRRGIF